MIFPLALSLAACAGNQQAKNAPPDNGPTDTDGNKNPAFADGFTAMARGDDAAARRDFAISDAAAPSDPYEQLNMAAAYQNTGAMNRAVPLYRQVIAANTHIVASSTTQPADQGLTLEQIAQRNCEKGGLDSNCNGLQPAQTAALMAPAAAQFESKSFTVFFAFNRAEISPASADTIREAARYSQAGSLAHIKIAGHTDSVGSDSYNQALSERRAASVEQELQRDGLSSGAMIARGVGERDPLVATANNVREGQNRRVEIIVE
jgi:outer membrane protein OmpA-like peptidoglycan-associated protein